MDIKGVIKSHGYTLIDVAREMNITKGGISQIVNGTPNIRTLRTIAEIVGCKVGDFFADEMTEKENISQALKCPHCGKEIHVTLSE
jgi:transcriptional regulator with XRE-family HTH domain